MRAAIVFLVSIGRRFAAASVVPLLMLGCGSASSEPRSSAIEPPAASSGDEATPEPSETVAEPAVEEPALAPAQGPATITVVADIANKPIVANVRVLDDQGDIKAQAKAGDAMTLPSGNYKLEIEIPDASIMADRPTQMRELRLTPGQNPNVEAHFRWAKVQLDVRVNGHSQPGAHVQLLRNGENVAEMKSGAAPVPITPGRYEADVLLKGAKIRVQGLLFPDSATQTVPVNVRF